MKSFKPLPSDRSILTLRKLLHTKLHIEDHKRELLASIFDDMRVEVAGVLRTCKLGNKNWTDLEAELDNLRTALRACSFLSY